MILFSRFNRLISFLLFTLFLLYPVNLYAHKIYIFAWAENGKIFSESKFSSNKPVKNAEISVRDKDDKILLTGTTSEQGTFAFEITEDIVLNVPEGDNSFLALVVDAGMGHMAEWKLDYDEIHAAYKGGSGKEEALKKKEKEKKPSIVNIGSGILIIFAFFLFLAYLKKSRLDKK